MTIFSVRGVSEELQRAVRIRAAETGETIGEIVERALRRELGLMEALTWQVIEDNGGGLHLAVMEGGRVVYYAYGYEQMPPGTLRESVHALQQGEHPVHEGWEMPEDIDDPQTAYDGLRVGETNGGVVVADNDGYYYDRMGRAAELEFQVRWQAWVGEVLLGEGTGEEEAIEAAVEEYESAIGYGDEPHLFADREALVAALVLSRETPS